MTDEGAPVTGPAPEPLAASPSAPPPRWRRYRVELAGLTFLIFVLGTVFWRVFWLGETFGDRDLAEYYHPAKSLIVPLARASHGVPVWNPFFSSGQPFAANPEHEVFHPMTTLFFLLPFELAFRLQVIVPLLLGFAAMAFLLRSLGRSRAAAVLGGLAWGFGGYLLSATNLLPTLFSASILPFTLGFAVRLARRPRTTDVAWLALAFGVQCLAGEPFALLATALLLGAVIGSVGRRAWPRGVVAIGLGLLLGVGVGAVTLVPGAHHARKTDRALGLAAAHSDDWSMPAVRAFDLLSPHVLGHVRPNDDRLFWGRSLYPNREGPYFYSLYPGLVVTVLAFAVGRRRLRALLPWMAVAAVGYLWALGVHFPLWGLLRRLPLLSGLRFPEKLALLFALPVVVLAAYGHDAVVLGPRRARRRLAGALALVAGAAMTGAIVLAVVASRGPAEPVLRAARLDILRVAAVAAALLVALWLFREHGRSARALALASILAVDLATAGWGIVHTQPVAALAAPPAALLPLLRQAPEGPIFHAAASHPSLGKADGLGRPPRTAQWGLATTLESDFDFTFLRWTNEGTDAFWRVARAEPGLAGPLLERRGAVAVVQFRPGTRWQGGLVVGPEGQGPVEVVSLPNPQPLVFAAARVEAVRGVEGWEAAVRARGPATRETVWVDDERFAGLASPPAPAEVRIKWREPARIAIDVEGRGPGPSFLAWNQTWDEGWRLTLDGGPAPLLRADVSLSGFVVPPGRHEVEIAYVAPWLRAGMGISVAALLACLGLVLCARRRPVFPLPGRRG